MPYEQKYHSDLLRASWRDQMLTWSPPGVPEAEALPKEEAARFSARLAYAERQRFQAGKYEPMLRLGAARTVRRGQLLAATGALPIVLYAGWIALSTLSGVGTDLPQLLTHLGIMQFGGVMAYQTMKTHRRRARLLEAIVERTRLSSLPPLDVVNHHRAAIIAQVEREEQRR